MPPQRNQGPKLGAKIPRAVRIVRWLRQAGVLAVLARWKLRWERPRPRPAPRFTLAVCAVVGDDGPFLREWLEFHQLVGVEHFYLFHAELGEETRRVLAEYAAAGEATLADRPGIAEDAAANLCLELHRGDAAWIAFLKGDDFLFGMEEDDLRPVLRDYEAWPGVQALGAYTRGPRTLVNTRFGSMRAVAVSTFYSPLGCGLWTSIPSAIAKTQPVGGRSRIRVNHYPRKVALPRFSNSYLDPNIARFAGALARRLGRPEAETPAAEVARRLPLVADRGDADPAPPVAPREIVVLGMARSGHHAVIDWMLSGAGPRWAYANDINVGENPFGTIGRVSRSRGCDEESLSRLSRPENWDDFDGRLVYSQEDFDPAIVGPWLGEIARGPGDRGRQATLLVLRDPWNFLASRLRAHHLEPDATRMPGTADAAARVMERWILHALEFIGQTSHLPRRINVNFGTFVRDRDYRRELAARLGIEPDEAVLKRVADYGPSSSFDRRRYDGKADQMRVLERWRHYADDPVFQKLTRDPRVRELGALIFPDLPAPP